MLISQSSKILIVNVPKMPESITEGTVSSWEKEIGDKIKINEEVASIDTDKMTLPVHSPIAGILKKKYFNIDEVVRPDQPLFSIERIKNDSK